MTIAKLLTGDALTVLRTLPDGVARCCVTSPPYWGLRDYGVAGQFGLEPTPEEYVAHLVEVFREVRRVLSDGGTLWLVLGDSYAGSGKGGGGSYDAERPGWETIKGKRNAKRWEGGNLPDGNGLKPKDLVGIPWMMAFALRVDGWWLRRDIIWSKPNPMPESVTDRPTSSHEYLFLLSKSERYYYDAQAIAEDTVRPGWMDETRTEPGNPDRNDGGGISRRPSARDNFARITKEAAIPGQSMKQHRANREPTFGAPTRNARSVWQIATQPYPEAHFATFPEELARRCILAGSAPGDTVLDPFSGSGTTCAVAVGNGRAAIGIELNPDYQELAEQRIGPMLCRIEHIDNGEPTA